MNDPRDDSIDAQLRAAFAPPPAAAFAAVARAVVAAQPVRRAPWLVPWLLAAAALLLLAGLWWSRPVRGPEGHDADELGALWAAAYQHALASAGNADGKAFCCDPQLDFCGTCEQRFAVRLGFGDDAATAGGAIQLRGCYCGLPTGGCIAALADTPDGPVGVFVTTSDRDPAPRLPPGSELQLARRELGTLVLYAISRRSQPSAAAPLEQFVLAP